MNLRYRYNRSAQEESLRFSSVLFLIFTIFVAAIIRIDFLVASNFIIDSDEAIVGLMAKHIVEGAEVPVFYYGQHYMGSFEPFILSLFFRIFGFQPWLIKIVPLIFSLLLIPVMFGIGFAIKGNRTAKLAAALTAVAPSTLILWSTKARGGFIELVLIGSLLTLFSLWWVKSEKFDWARLFAITFLFGFGWWTNNQVVYFFPALACTVTYKVFSHARSLSQGFIDYGRTILWCLGASLLGGLPFWIYNILFDFASFRQLLREHEAEISEHLSGFFEYAFPILIGAKRYWHTEDLFLYSSLVSYFIYGVLFLVAIIATLSFRETKKIPFLFLFCVLISATTIFVLSPFGYLSMAPRYLLPLYIPIIGIAVIGLEGIFTSSKNVGRFIFGLLLIFNLSSTYLYERAIPGEPFVRKGERVSKNHDDLYAWFEENSISIIKTNYWIGYRIAYETAEKVRFIVFQEPYQSRIQEYEDIGEEYGRERIPFVLVPGQARIVGRALSLLGYKFKGKALSGYVVIYDIEPPRHKKNLISLENFSPFSSVNEEHIGEAFDGDHSTRWGSAMPQNPSMEIGVVFNSPTLVSGLRYDHGQWLHDYPRGLLVIGETEDGKEFELINERQYEALRYIEVGGEWKVYFKPKILKSLKVKQRGEHPILDWSIAELEIYGLDKEAE